jgi:hypothetical protein
MLRADDVTYGGEDGQLSVAFVQRSVAGNNAWWTSSAYTGATPTKAVVKIQDTAGKVYIVETTTPPLLP